MQDPIETVTAFLAECGRGKAEMAGAFRTYFTSETTWDLVGSGKTTGANAAVAKVEATQADYGMDHLRSEILAIAANGGSVLTERIDNVIAADGSAIDSCPCMGIFEVEGGRITAWREYYDTKTHG